MKIEFFVPGKPSPGGSKRGFFIKSINRVVLTPACKNTKPWMATVSSFAKEAYKGALLTRAVELQMSFRILRPKSHFGTGKKVDVVRESAPMYSIVRPDLTKLERSTEDALTGIIWRDDSQVAVKHTEKRYVERDCGVWISITGNE